MKDYKAENERLKIEIRKVWADYLASDFETCCEMDNFLDGLEKLVELANEDKNVSVMAILDYLCYSSINRTSEHIVMDIIVKWQEKCHIFSVAYELPH